MHFGVVVADVPSARLTSVLDEVAPRFVDSGPLATLDELDSSGENGWELGIGDLDDRGFLWDGTLLLSSHADLLTRVSAATGGLVIGCGAETVSGTFYLAAARADRLLRHYFQCNADLARPYSMGPPLPGEEADKLDDIDGGGLFAILAAHGFDYDRWYDRAPKRRLSWTAEYLDQPDSLPWAGPAEAALERHRVEYKLAPGDMPPIVVQARVVASSSKKPWWRFW